MLSRRRLLKLGLGSAAVGVVGLPIYMVGVEPVWLSVARVRLPVRGLPPAFEGFTIAQMSDFHHGPVPIEWIRQVVAAANDLQPDLIALTGDYITRGDAWVEPVAEALADLRAPAGVLASLGNHDYESHSPGFDPRIAGRIMQALSRGGITVLRNAAVEVRRGGANLTFVGFDDLWAGMFDPAGTMKAVSRDAPVIALSHNPDTAAKLAPHGLSAALSGHTHGGQINVPLVGPLRLPVVDRRLVHGLYDVDGMPLYARARAGCCVCASTAGRRSLCWSSPECQSRGHDPREPARARG